MDNANGSFLKGFLNKYSRYKSAATTHFILMKTSKKCFRIVPLYLPLGRQQTRTQDKNNKYKFKKICLKRFQRPNSLFLIKNTK
jgi:hypothetical protein